MNVCFYARKNHLGLGSVNSEGSLPHICTTSTLGLKLRINSKIKRIRFCCRSSWITKFQSRTRSEVKRKEVVLSKVEIRIKTAKVAESNGKRKQFTKNEVLTSFALLPDDVNSQAMMEKEVNEKHCFGAAPPNISWVFCCLAFLKFGKRNCSSMYL